MRTRAHRGVALREPRKVWLVTKGALDTAASALGRRKADEWTSSAGGRGRTANFGDVTQLAQARPALADPSSPVSPLPPFPHHYGRTQSHPAFTAQAAGVLPHVPPRVRRLGSRSVPAPLRIVRRCPSSLCPCAVCGVVAHPSIADINDQYLTLLTPLTSFIGAFWLVLFVLLVGQAVMLMVVKNPDAVAMLTSGVGLRLSMINVLVS